jgi:hypothetical protein
MTRKLAKIRPYYKYELADLYKMSRRNLMHWIEEHDIEEKLIKTGYIRSQQILTIKQVEIIFDYFGHPTAGNDKDIHSDKLVQLTPYTKWELANLYGFSKKTLLKQISSIPKYKIRCRIMDSNADKNVCRISSEKKTL